MRVDDGAAAVEFAPDGREPVVAQVEVAVAREDADAGGPQRLERVREGKTFVPRLVRAARYSGGNR